MTTIRNGEITETTKLDPYQHYELGVTAEQILDYIKTHDDTNSPIFGDKAVMDVLNLVCEETGGIIDPKMAVIYGIYCGLAWAENGF